MIVSVFITGTLWFIYHTGIRIRETHHSLLFISATGDGELQDVIIEESPSSSVESLDPIEVRREKTINENIYNMHGHWPIFISRIDGI